MEGKSSYFITGGTGFIGRNFVEKLKAREGDIYVLTRTGSRQKFEALVERFGEGSERLIPITGDLREPNLGLDKQVIAELRGKIQYFCHFAAIYDMAASAEDQVATNIEGTRNAIELADATCPRDPPTGPGSTPGSSGPTRSSRRGR